MSRRNRIQGVFWILTIKRDEWEPPLELPEGVSWIRGQEEIGEGGFHHWQIFVAFREKKSLQSCKARFTASCHAELSRSEAAAAYVWKELSAVPDTRFEFGSKPFRRNSRTDWDMVWECAKSGDVEAIPASVRVQSYGSIRRIGCDFIKPVAMERTCSVYWGPTATGKSRRAWDEAGVEAYPKDPRTKFWDGYQCEKHVVIDEFRGVIDVSNLLRWLDRYPVRVEVKGSARVLCATHIWITSNLAPEYWWPELDPITFAAFRRRIVVTEFHQEL